MAQVPAAPRHRSRLVASLVLAAALVAEPAGLIPSPKAAGAAPATALAIPRPAVPVEIGRTVNTITYANPDGTRTTYASSRPTNYRAVDGQWRKIDPRIVDAAGGLFKNAAGELAVRFPAVTGPDGSVSFVDDGGREVAHMPQGLAFDSANDDSIARPAARTPVELRLVGEPGSQAVEASVSRAWLEDPARIYPVRVDPSFNAGRDTPGGDAYFRSDQPDLNCNGNCQSDGGFDRKNKVGDRDGAEFVSVAKFDIGPAHGKRIVTGHWNWDAFDDCVGDLFREDAGRVAVMVIGINTLLKHDTHAFVRSVHLLLDAVADVERAAGAFQLEFIFVGDFAKDAGAT